MIASIFLVLALVFFLLAVFSVSIPVNPTAAGLVFLTLAFLAPYLGPLTTR